MKQELITKLAKELIKEAGLLEQIKKNQLVEFKKNSLFNFRKHDIAWFDHYSPDKKKIYVRMSEDDTTTYGIPKEDVEYKLPQRL